MASVNTYARVLSMLPVQSMQKNISQGVVGCLETTLSVATPVSASLHRDASVVVPMIAAVTGAVLTVSVVSIWPFESVTAAYVARPLPKRP